MSENLDTTGDGFEEWYPAAHRKVLAALIAYSGDPDRASEATDEAFARALSKWADVREKDSPVAWVFVVARNALRRRIRAVEKEHAFFLRVQLREAEVSDPSQVVADGLEMAEILRPLTRRQRTMVVLHYGLDVSQEQLGELMGVSRSTVASTLLDARRVLSGDRPAPGVGRRRKYPAADVIVTREETSNA